ncbi:MACPF domain-containing protein [Pleurotus pulmonarius]
MNTFDEEPPRLGALDWLGRGIDMTSPTPFNIRSVERLIKAHFIIETDKDPKERTVIIDGVKYTIPSVVSASAKSGVNSNYVTFPSGASARRAFVDNTNVTDQLVVKTSLSSYPFEKSLPENDQFAFWNYKTDTYTASLREYMDFVNQGALLESVSALPKPFTETPDVIDAYTKFFEDFGTHVIMGTSFGARCSATVWGSNQYPDVNDNWSRYVTALLKGLNDRGEYDVTVYGERQYQIFETLVQTIFKAIGGDPHLAEKLNQGDYDFDTFQQWADSAREHSVLSSITAMELWNLLRDSDVAALRDSADSLQAAFNAIVAQQKRSTITTLVVLEGKTGVAELDLLTPGATVGVGGPLPAFDPTTQDVIGLSATKIRVGKPLSPPVTRVVPFYIVNDGTPIDISIKRDVGLARVLVNGTTYTNSDKRVREFYRVPVTVEGDVRLKGAIVNRVD